MLYRRQHNQITPVAGVFNGTDRLAGRFCRYERQSPSLNSRPTQPEDRLQYTFNVSCQRERGDEQAAIYCTAYVASWHFSDVADLTDNVGSWG
jgi:hypothetical protein